jgi:hypothetical protein
MADGKYIPRSARRTEEARRQYTEVLVPGIPDHLESAVFNFLNAVTPVKMLPDLEASLRRPLEREYNARGLISVRNSVEKTWAEAGDDWLLDVIDHRLHHLLELHQEVDADAYTYAGSLRQSLIAGGSAYEVVRGEDEGRLRLEDRVTEEVRMGATTAMAHGKSGDHLRIAWSAIYSRSPNPPRRTARLSERSKSRLHRS